MDNDKIIMTLTGFKGSQLEVIMLEWAYRKLK